MRTIKQDLAEYTVAVWQPRASRRLSDEDVREIGENLTSPPNQGKSNGQPEWRIRRVEQPASGRLLRSAVHCRAEG